MDGMFHNSTLSSSNYGRLLRGWSQLPLQQNINFDAGNSRYNFLDAMFRNKIINDFGWNIIDRGVAPIILPRQ